MHVRNYPNDPRIVEIVTGPALAQAMGRFRPARFVQDRKCFHAHIGDMDDFLLFARVNQWHVVDIRDSLDGPMRTVAQPLPVREVLWNVTPTEHEIGDRLRGIRRMRNMETVALRAKAEKRLDVITECVCGHVADFHHVWEGDVPQICLPDGTESICQSWKEFPRETTRIDEWCECAKVQRFEEW